MTSPKHADIACDKKTAGRPKDERKHAAILGAAREHFLTYGFERASMDAIAESAGVSKLTIYSHFQNKETLFKEIIHAKCAQFGCEEIYVHARALPLEEGLSAIARRFMQLVSHPEALQMHRVVMSECARHPKMAAMFYEAGPVLQKNAFTDYLIHACLQGWLVIPDDARACACEQFFSLLKGGPYMRLLLGLTPAPDEAEITAHADNCVRMFIRAYRPS